MAAVSVGTTAVEVTGWSHGDRIWVQNLGSAPVYYGRTSGVTTATGIQIAAAGSVTFAAPAERVGHIFLISGTAGQDVRWEVVG